MQKNNKKIKKTDKLRGRKAKKSEELLSKNLEYMKKLCFSQWPSQWLPQWEPVSHLLRMK